MKVNKMLSFRISEDEMHELLADCVAADTRNTHYGEHVRKNHYDLDFIDGEWVLSVDGELDDEVGKPHFG